MVIQSAVALRKESVDRNLYYGDDLRFADGSLSARRAWIEIEVENGFAGVLLSLSARRAWIEIGISGVDKVSYQVALRKESVDRNVKSMFVRCSLIVSLSARRAWIEMLSHGLYSLVTISRSPQGERG